MESPPPKDTQYPTAKTEEGWNRIYPIGQDGSERVWSRNYETTMKLWKKGKLKCSNQQTIIQKIDNVGRKILTSVWLDKKFNAVVHGTNLLSDILGQPGKFPYPKSVNTVKTSIDATVGDESAANVVDYFAGSGTTGHAVINLNREDEGERKYILVEVGDHFEAVLLPRIKKIVYSPDWKDGKPVSRNGSGQFFKYIRLESYEDTLDSLELTLPSSAQWDKLAQNPALREDYQLRYALGEETAGSASLSGKNFTDPFAYTLSVVRDGIRSEVPVDLPETFNCLIGLHVETRRYIEDVITITGTDAEGRRCLILWRSQEEMDNSALDAWFTSQRERFGALDVIYVNGDHTLNALKLPKDSWAAKTIEPVFRELMFRYETQ